MEPDLEALHGLAGLEGHVALRGRVVSPQGQGVAVPGPVLDAALARKVPEAHDLGTTAIIV